MPTTGQIPHLCRFAVSAIAAVGCDQQNAFNRVCEALSESIMNDDVLVASAFSEQCCRRKDNVVDKNDVLVREE